jgi:uncharacterized repeat protein (TIGR02543 family)
MRCKNCGYDNDDNLYICQNCGSPLYDEDEVPEDATKQFQAVTNNNINPDSTDTNGDTPAKNADDSEDDKKKKQLTIAIIALAIILVLLVTGIIVVVAKNSSNKKVEESTSVSTTQSVESTSSSTTQSASTTQQTTESTTATTETTTEATTTTTTALAKFRVSLGSDEGGEVEGDGEYTKGSKVTLFARADDGYTFNGWYDQDGALIADSSKTKYQFTINDDTYLYARFSAVDEPTSPDTINGEDD